MFKYYAYVYALTLFMPNCRLPNNWFCYRSWGTMQVVKEVSVVTEEDCKTGNGNRFLTINRKLRKSWKARWRLKIWDKQITWKWKSNETRWKSEWKTCKQCFTCSVHTLWLWMSEIMQKLNKKETLLMERYAEIIMVWWMIKWSWIQGWNGCSHTRTQNNILHRLHLKGLLDTM